MMMENKLQEVQELILLLKDERGEISDGFHSFNELYEFRKLYNALLFNEWARQITTETAFRKDARGRTKQIVVAESNKYDVHKSIRHNNGELCFGGGWFVVIAILPSGQITNHYEMKDWDLFKIPEVEKAKYEFDGHTSQDVVERMLNLLSK
jgi:hypothetical protein